MLSFPTDFNYIRDMKKLLVLLLFIPLVFACSGSDDDSPITLTIDNKDAVAESVIEVRLVGYEFLNLNIISGSSRTFTLSGGINGGISNVNVICEFYAIILLAIQKV